MVSGPNFFIVGAAKAGTTALHAALSRHPDIFMTAVKEPGFFAPDLSLATEWNRELAAYLSLFAGADGAAVRGESSVAYLYSEQAAGRIAEFNPGARIAIVLRHPVEAIAAGYADARKWGIEPERSLAGAVAASRRDRPANRRPGGQWLRYLDVVRYAEQVQRYLAVFPREQVHLARYDELVAEPERFVAELLGFLGVPRMQLARGRHNTSRRYRSAVVQRLVMRPYAAGAPRAGAGLALWLRRAVVALNTARPAAQPSPKLRAELTAELAPDIRRLAETTGLDLDSWLAPSG